MKLSTSQNQDSSPAYYIRNRGRVLGPFSIERLIALRSRGQFSRVHEVSEDGQNWQSATTLSALFAGSVETAISTAEDGGTSQLSPIQPTPAFPAPGAAPATPGAAWYYNVAGEQHGPVTIMELRGLMTSGKLRSDEFVWKNGMQDWLPIESVPELQVMPSSLGGVGMPGSSIGSRSVHDDGIHHTSGLAVAGLVMGILGLMIPFLGLVFNLLAVIFGAASLKAIARSRIPLGGRGMALSGLILGIIGLALWGMILFVQFAVVVEALSRMHR